MSTKTLSLTLRQTKMGWCLFINGEPYAVGMQAYCIRVADSVRHAYARDGWAAFPELNKRKGGAA